MERQMGMGGDQSKAVKGGDLDFLNKGNKGEESKTSNLDFVTLYTNAPRADVEKIAEQEQVGSWIANEFTLEQVNWMLAKPGLFVGTEIPSEGELIELKKIVSARKVLEQ